MRYWLATLVLLAAWVRAEAADRPLVRIGGQRYTIKDLTGYTEAEMRRRFQAEIKGYPTAKLAELLGLTEAERARRFARQTPAQQRKALEAQLWDLAVANVLLSVTNRLVLAQTAERIIDEQDIDVASYFDLPRLKQTIKEQIAYIDCLFREVDDRGSDEKWRAEFVKRTGVAQTKADWEQARQLTRKFPPVLRWQVEFTRNSPLAEEVFVKVMLAHALLAETCAKGVYARQADDVSQFTRSLLEVYEITGYRGDAAALEAFCREVCGEDGYISSAGMAVLRRWLQHCPGTTVTGRALFGSKVIDGLTLPVPGRLYRPTPSSYRLIGWKTRAPRVGTTANQREALAILRKNYAYRLAAADYFPRVESFVEGWKVNLDLYARTLAQDGLDLVAPEMRRGSYGKKPYPALIFDEFKRHRPALETFSVAAARAALARDDKAGAQLLARIRKAAAEVKAKPVRAAYLALAERLGKSLEGRSAGR
jgi:hypothetical protein